MQERSRRVKTSRCLSREVRGIPGLRSLAVNLGVLGSVEATEGGHALAVAGTKPRAVLTLLGLHVGEVVGADALVELLWGESPPRTAAKAIQTHVSALRRALGDGVVMTKGGGWTLSGVDTDVA